MSNRPPTGIGRPPTASRPGTGIKPLDKFGRPPGTATRLTTGMNPGTARPGSRSGTGAGQGIGLTAQIKVTDRPMTQQGLTGMRTASKVGPHRQVQDKSYFLGLLRTKLTELNLEINRLSREVENHNQDNVTYIAYEKRAEALATEIKELQGELGDFNTLVDKLNTGTHMDEVKEDYMQLKLQNDREAKLIDGIFTERRDKEAIIKELERELDQERRLADNMVDDMEPSMKEHYTKLKESNITMLQQLEKQQQELDTLNTKKMNLEDELSLSEVKQEAVSLYEKLNDLEEKRDSLMDENRSQTTPSEEREKLLKQVKEDNHEIASMERQITDIREKVASTQEELRLLDTDLEEHQGELNTKYKELKKREETMDEFLKTFDEAKASELERNSQLESSIVSVLEQISRNMSHFQHLPSPQDLVSLKDDLAFKEGEMEKSKTTSSSLTHEQHRLQMDLQKVEQLEDKIKQEMDALKVKIDQMRSEIKIYENLDGLKEQAEEKRQHLTETLDVLTRRKEVYKTMMENLSTKHETSKSQLKDNETHAQLENLERKWQHQEQNNFIMKEFIATKTMESDYTPVKKNFLSTLNDYNKLLQSAPLKTSLV